MALEPITRQEKIIAGQDLTPITRMEKFLKNFGGSGVGGGAQPDLSQTDTTKPDYVKGVIRQESLPEGYPYKEGETIHTMAPEFLPAGVGGGVQVVTLTMGENYLVVSNFTGAEIVEMLVKSPVQFISDFNGVLLPLAFIGCYEDVDGYGVVLQCFGKSTDGAKIIENMFAIPASSTACKSGTGHSYAIS